MRVIEAGALGRRKTGAKYGVEIWSVPFVAIIGRDGKILDVDSQDSDSGSELLYDWINEEIDRKNAQLRGARPVGQ